MFGKDGTNELEPVSRDALGNTPRDGKRRRNGQSLDLDREWTSTLHDHGETGPGGIFDPAFKQNGAWIFDLLQTIAIHAENTCFVGGAKAILDRTEKPEKVLPVPRKLQDSIHHVLQHFGSRYIPIFGDVTDDDHGNRVFFGCLDEIGGTIANLGR